MKYIFACYYIHLHMKHCLNLEGKPLLVCME
jgi:hypothetical protein